MTQHLGVLVQFPVDDDGADDDDDEGDGVAAEDDPERVQEG